MLPVFPSFRPSLRLLRPALLTGCLLGSVLVPRAAGAELANFDIGARLYTKFLYQNNDSQGVLTLGNPHPNGDNFSGSNGIGSEGELTIVGRVSQRVSAGMRLQSRYGSNWHDWWENGNQTDKKPLTGETMGMDHAQYIKLRGTWLRVGTELDALRWVHVGSSDLNMFNPWTIGKIRYIDRDNASGLFAEGSFAEDLLSYNAGVIALPKLFVGPGWSTGLDDAQVAHPFLTRDFAYGLKATFSPDTDWSLISTTTFTDDLEVDVADPDATGTANAKCEDALGNPVAGCEEDHAVSLVPRYRNLVSTLELKGLLGETILPELLVGYSLTRINEDVAANGVERNSGIFPVLFKNTGETGLADMALRARVELEDLGGSGLGLRLEYFNIGEDFSSIFAARREADVLLTDGIVAPGQLATLNLANEFVDFDEAWVESCIGWHGATALLNLDAGALGLEFEATGITYNTNTQGRDTETIYPDFQHNQGFTDTDLYDYANTLDRGSDPRAVYHENQDRRTLIGVLGASYALPFGQGWTVTAKGKVVRDTDGRLAERKVGGSWKSFTDDDYEGTMITGRLSLSMPVTRWLTLGPGVQIDRWSEKNRSGTTNLGYDDYDTSKEKAFLGARIEYAGVVFTYYLEYLHKFQDIEGDKEDHLWRVIRSKGTAEVAW